MKKKNGFASGIGFILASAGIISTFSVHTWEVVGFTGAFLLLSILIIMGGVQQGIERMSKILIPAILRLSFLHMFW